MNYATIGNGLQVFDLRGELPTQGEYPRRELAAIKYLVIHHSGVEGDTSPLSMARYHVEQLGWPAIGYHFVVSQKGAIYWCNDLDRASYHVAKRNTECLGICLPGDWTTQQPPEAQLEATRRLVAELQYQLGSFVPVVGHQDVALSGYRTACPGESFPLWRERVTVEAPKPEPEPVSPLVSALDHLWAVADIIEPEHADISATVRNDIRVIKQAVGLA